MSTDKKSEIALTEEQMLALWAKEKTFEKSVSNRQGGELFNFNDGPPFANGLPHFGHSLVTGIKDSILRYKTMRGYYVPRRNGWDCHGLPVEFAIEKDFGVSGKKQILELGLEKFNAASRDSIFRYKGEWEQFLARFGRWSDYDNYYATVDTNYTESVWWILGEINKKGLLYKGFKSTPYCPRCETPLSNFELNEGYKDNVEDPSVFALFPLVDEPHTALLAWTTTPWTLPANAALAVDPQADYAYVELKSDGSQLILAKKRLEVLDLRKADYKLVKTVKGRDLVGMRYEPLYQANFEDHKQTIYQVYAPGEGVDVEDGTGILHVAPRYGEFDLQLGLDEKLPLIESVDASGRLIFGPKEAIGKFFKEADNDIIADLTRKNRLFAAETAEHTYPFCWRCDTPLMYFAISTWFISVTSVKDDLIKTAEQINWVPANIKSGRFGKWLEGARDWAISRNRYWGAPLPIWVNTKDETDYIVVSSIEELEKLAGKDAVVKALKKDGGIDLHRPFIDQISFQKDGKTYKRVEEVLDCWFESGSMPVAQWHYPFENREQAEKLLTADFITEGLDQTRLWFYVQHVISTILFNRPAFKNVIVNGIILAADGQKLSKRLRNYPPTEDVFDLEGADAWRLYLLSSKQATQNADYMRFNRSAVTDLQRNVLATLNNSFGFFKTYSQLDDWQAQDLTEPTSSNLLDQWILARLQETVNRSTKAADDFKIAEAIEPVLLLVDDLSNWYIRRSRRRFWKSENDSDKQQAYATLHYVMARVCQLLAPWAPFTSDNLWRQLMAGTGQVESVHLSDWPSVKEPDKASIKLLEHMKEVRALIADGLAQRAASGIKVRQPLATITAPATLYSYASVIKEELNVKGITWLQNLDANLSFKPELDLNITDKLKDEGIARELIRHVQNLRKKAGFNVEDRIKLKIQSDSPEITNALKEFKEMVYGETLAVAELTDEEPEHSEDVKVEGQTVTIKLRRT